MSQIVDHLVDRHRTDADTLKTREGEQLRNELGASTTRFERASCEALETRLFDIRGEDFEAADHRREQIGEVVRDAAGQAADRLQLLRLTQRLFGAPALDDLLSEAI